MKHNWTSPDLGGLNVLSKTDPHYGDRTTRLVNIVKRDSDITMFQVPLGFKIQ